MTALLLRLVLETEDLDAALAFYRDTLGLPEMIDEVEVGRAVAHPFPLTLRVAFEVVDAAATTTALVGAGAVPVAPPTRTPWNSLNSRMEGPDGLQLTAFQELGEREA